MVAEVIPLPVSETGARLMPNAPRTWAEAWIRLCLLHDNHPTLIYLSGFGWHRWNPAGCWRREEDTAVHAEASRFLASSTVLRRPSDGGETDLVSREQTRRAVAAFSRLIRDKWVDFGNRYGQQIAAAVGADPKLVMAELDKAVRLQLDEIANVQAPVPSAVRKA